MESRRIRLISEAYLNGWLDGKKRQSWNTSREEVILYLTEQRLYSEILAVKTSKDSSFAAGAIARGNIEPVKIADNDYKTYGKYKFPSLFENAKMEGSGNKKELTKEDIADLLVLHKKMIADFDKNKKK